MTEGKVIEEVVIGYLNQHLSVPAFAEKPDKEPSKYVLVEKTGGSETDYIESAMIAIQSYADSLISAAKLNKEVKTKMKDIVNLDEIVSAKLVRDYNFTDTTKKKYRYQAVFSLVHY